MTNFDSTRRAFIHTGALTPLASAAFGQSGPRSPGPNDTVRIALIGCGGMGNFDLAAFLKVPGVRVVALCDVDQNRLQKTAAKVGGPVDTYGDFRKVIERKDIDAVVIATPDHWHAIPALQALRAGKDVYLEKPVAHTIEEGQLLVRTARQYNRILQIGLQQRSGTIFLEAMNLVRSGKIGRVSMAHCINAWNQSGISTEGRARGLGNPPDSDPPEGVDYDFWLGPAPKRPFNPNRFHWNYIYYWDYSGGMLLIWTVHLLDTVYQIFDLKGPNAVNVSGGKYLLDDSRDTPDTAMATFDFDGMTVVCSCLHTTTFTFGGRRVDHGIQLIGTQGTMLIDRKGYQILPEGANSQPILSPEGLTDGYGEHQRKFVDCVRSRTKPPCDAEDGHRSSTALQLANISYRTGRKIFWDPRREQILNDPDACRYLSKEYRKPWSLEVS